MAKTPISAGQVSINQALPEKYRDYHRTLDKKALESLLRQIAQEDPDAYPDVASNLLKIGNRFSSLSGSYSPSVHHMRKTDSAKAIQLEYREKERDILDDDNLSSREKSDKLLELASDYSDKQRKAVYEEALSKKNPFAIHAKIGMRGSPTNVNSILGGDYLYVDAKDRVIPYAILHSYGEGLRPTEQFAGSYGGRKGLLDTKLAIGDAGYLCLAGNTLVRMADFSTRRIEDIVVGDMVLGVDGELKGVPVRVVNTFDNGMRECWKTEFHNSFDTEFVYLESTVEHKLYGCGSVAGKEAEFGQYPVGCNNLLAAVIYDTGESFRRQSQSLLGQRQTYDIEVDSDNHLFVLANGLIVSNSKQLVQMSHRGIVTKLDSDSPADDTRGLPVSVDDEDNVGALLSRPAGGYARNTRITSAVLNDLKKQGISKILVRSPIVGGRSDGSLYSRDVGYREKGRLPVPGENPSIRAVQTFSEPLAQGAMCLAENTHVRMADHTTKPIQQIKPGDRVLGSTKRGEAIPVTVKALYDNGVRQCYRYDVQLENKQTNVTVRCTPDHKFLGVPDYDADSTELSYQIVPISDSLPYLFWLENPKYCLKTVPVKVTVTPGQAESLRTYDIEVDHPDHLFVLANGLMCSNSCLDEHTEVRMADFTVKEIKDINVGDKVWGVNQNDNVSLTTVTNVFDTGERNCFKYTFKCPSSNEFVEVICTEEHRFKSCLDELLKKSKNGDEHQITLESPYTVVQIGLLSELDSVSVKVLPENEDSSGMYFLRNSEYAGKRQTYDLEVSNNTHLYVLANGLVTHNSKHSGGVASSTTKTVGGFKLINQLIQVPKIFTDGATHSTVDGTVERIEDAPVGGKYIYIRDEKHYVPEEHAINVKPGDKVEAGDVLTDGVPNPAMIVKHKGIGEGRRYFMKVFKDSFAGAGLQANRRNAELLARGAIDNVNFTEEYEGFLPGDSFPYSMLEKRYQPRETSYLSHVKSASGKYLEKPVLHYSIGTRLKPSMLKEIEEFGIEEVNVNDEPPPFEPEMIRGAANLQYDPDAFVRMGGSGIKRGLLKSVHRGGESNLDSTSYITGIAFDPDFGKKDRVIQSPLLTLNDVEKMKDYL